jgi:predicted nucleotide-binding protein (sugar kinase/HSP70/actin superfamily)
MYSNQIAKKNHPHFTAERRRRRSGALLLYWWVTFLARLAITHVVSFSCGWESVVLGAVRYLLRSDLIVLAYDSDIHTNKFCC